MTKSVKTLDELRDSRLLFEKVVPPFGYIITLVVLTLLIGVIVWSTHAPKIFEVISTGTVTNAEANYVMPAYTGTILDSVMEEGKIVAAGEKLFTIASNDYDLQAKQLEETRIVYEAKAAQYEKLVRSIQDNTNYFNAGSSGDILYYSTYEAYQAQVEQNGMDTSAYKQYGYSDEQIQQELEKNSAKISEIYHTAIQSAENSISECKMQIASIEAQLSALKSGQDNYIVTAPASGVLHMLADYKEGMVVQTGSAVATITPEQKGTLIETYVAAAEVSRIHMGDSVEMGVSGLMQSVYGTISGTVTQISSNATGQESGDGKNTPVFKVLIQPDALYVSNDNGDKVDLNNGMTVEARIQYKEVTYFDYVMQKIGFKAT